MKKLRFLTVLLGMLVLAAGLGARDFEGTIRFKTTSQDRSTKGSADNASFTNFCVKGALMRVDVEASSGQQFSSIIDSVNRQVITLMPQQKMYMTMALPEPQKTAGAATPAKDAEVVRTGETETILGYRCEKVIVKSKDGETEIWGAKGFGAFHAMGDRNPKGRPAPISAWETALADLGLFPLRRVNRDKSGKEVKRMEVVSIDAQSLPDAAFAPPADYRKFEMPSIPGLSGFGRGGE
jgi:Domain of unknown function (DUF4412)